MVVVENLVVRYDASVAVDGVTMVVHPGERVALVGPNGAGKTSLVKAIIGVVPVSAGSITRNGRVALAPECRQLFGDLTVEDNLMLGAWGLKHRDPQWLYDLFPRLKPLVNRLAGQLSGGQQQMVTIARALMARPDVLAIDELSLGLAPLATLEILDCLDEWCARNHLAILLIEQNVSLAFKFCDMAYVMESGRIVASGTTADLAQDPIVQQAYLGEGNDENG